MRASLSKYTYIDKPSFGIDIGHSSIKTMQLTKLDDGYAINAYGNIQIEQGSINKGIINNAELIAKKIYELITTHTTGRITLNRAAFSIPNEYSYTRVITVPKMSNRELRDVIENEIQQSMPLPASDLYYDYDTVHLNDALEIQLVATPRKIVDSYMNVSKLLGIETAFVETNIGAVTRAVKNSEITKDLVSLIVDLGSSAADLTLYDGSQIRITSTANCGGEDITRSIANRLDINSVQAHIIKTRFGLDPSKRQKDIIEAASSVLERLFQEIKKVDRYFREHSDNKSIEQIIIVGGGSNIPGLSHYMTDKLKIPTRAFSEWKNINFGSLAKPDPIESTLYTTVIGLAIGREEDFSE